MNQVFLYSLLVISLFLASASASLYKALDPVPGTMKATWRLQLTAFAQMVPYIYDWTSKFQLCYTSCKKYFPCQMLAAILMSGNFICFTVSLEHTSVAHTVLYINTSPVIIVLGSLIHTRKVRIGDLVGVLIGLLGMILVSRDMESNNSSFLGDMIALGGAFCMCMYLLLGNYVLQKSGVPIWNYIFPISCTASMIAWGYSIVAYDCSMEDYLEWKEDQYLPYVMLGILPGFICNSSYVLLVKHLRPVVVTSFMNFSPFISVFIAWFFGFENSPGFYTWLGGVILISGNMIITLGKDDKRALQSSQSLILQSMPTPCASGGQLSLLSIQECDYEIEVLDDSSLSLN